MHRYNKEVRLKLHEVYKKVINFKEEVTLKELIERFIKAGHLMLIPAGYPIKRFYLKEEYTNSETLQKERLEANYIYKQIKRYIMSHVSQNERDMINMYLIKGDAASFPYETDEHRLTTLYNALDTENKFKLYTQFGDLYVKFDELNLTKYPTLTEDSLMTFDDSTNTIIIFVDNQNEIYRNDIIYFLRKKYDFIHELTHYIDMVNKTLEAESDPSIFYIDRPSEFKAFTQSFIGAFGKFLFLNQKRIDFRELQDQDYVERLFNIFIGMEPNTKGYIHFLDGESREIMRKVTYNWNEKNKNEFKKQLYKYITNYYNKPGDIDLAENKIKSLIYLFRLEENIDIGEENGE